MNSVTSLEGFYFIMSYLNFLKFTLFLFFCVYFSLLGIYCGFQFSVFMEFLGVWTSGSFGGGSLSFVCFVLLLYVSFYFILLLSFRRLFPPNERLEWDGPKQEGAGERLGGVDGGKTITRIYPERERKKIYVQLKEKKKNFKGLESIGSLFWLLKRNLLVCMSSHLS